MNYAPKPCRHCGEIFTKERRVQPFCGIRCYLLDKVDSSDKDACWVWRGTTNSEGYGVVSYNYKTLLAHRISYEIHSSHPGDFCVCHSCDNPPCCNPKHLFLGTQADNVSDRVAKGRTRSVSRPKRGESSHMAKVAEKDVREMRALHAQGVTLAVISKGYPAITKGAVWRIVKRLNWRHI